MFKKLKSLFRKTRSVQEIFDAVIDGGFYTEREDYMCFSLKGAYSEGVISKKEMRIAGRSIKSYLGRRYSLEAVLLEHGLPRKFSDRLALYRDWANRPSLK